MALSPWDPRRKKEENERRRRRVLITTMIRPKKNAAPPPPTNLVTNGTFDSNANGWTGQLGATPSSSSGELLLTGADGQTGGRGTFPVTVEANKTYDLVVKGRIGTNATNWGFRLTPASDGSSTGAIYTSGQYTNTTMTEYTVPVTPTSSGTLYVSLFFGKNTSGTSQAFYDDVSLIARP